MRINKAQGWVETMSEREQGDAPDQPPVQEVVAEPVDASAEAPPGSSAPAPAPSHDEALAAAIQASVDMPRRVVGIGGSAGAFEAAGTLLGEMYPGSGIALIVVQHLDPGHPSQLATLLSRQTPMKVVEAEQGQRIQPDTVYVIPAAQAMTVEGGCLRLAPRGHEVGHQWIIDAFLTSLALDVGPAAIGVLLSGTLSDGAEGMAAIHRAGGATLVQSRDSAKFPDMPAAALRLGIVDMEVPIEEMAEQIIKLSQDNIPFERPAEATAMDQVRGMVRDATGLDLRDYKLPTVTRRLQRRMDAVKAGNLVDYAQYMAKEPDEIHALHDDMLIAVTRFFRDQEVFDQIERVVIPAILDTKSNGDTVRVWVPGCCTGQEAYSLGMLFTKAIAESGKRIELQVFGTDRSAPAIAIARQGTYDVEVRNDIPQELFTQYMQEENGVVRVRKGLRNQCIFAEHDLLHDPPFSSIDLVSCRNVLIYMDGPAQARTMDAMHFGLRLGGWMILGSNESGLRSDNRFTQAVGTAPIYRRSEGSRRLPPRLRSIAMRGEEMPVKVVQRRVADAVPLLGKQAWTTLPTICIVDDKFDVLLDLPELHAPEQFNILKVTKGPVADEIRSLVPDTIKDGRPHVGKVNRDGETIHILAMPVHQEHDKRVLLMFSSDRFPRRARLDAGLAPVLAKHLDTLNDEVQNLIASYEGILEELSCAHEEAMSANEELQSGNEELLTANEEAQSAAEELRTLNEEMARRQGEAEAALDDIEAVLEAVSEPVLVIEEGGFVRRMNSDARVMFNAAEGPNVHVTKLDLPFRNLDLGKLVDRVARGEGRRDIDAVHVDGDVYKIQITRAVGRQGARNGAVVRVLAQGS